MISLTNSFQMGEISGAGDGGDLLAVVRGYTNGFSNTSTTTTIENPPAKISFGPSAMEQDCDDFDLFRTYPNFFETTTVLDELEQLYKPFYPMLESLSPSVSAPRAERDPEKVLKKENFTGFPPVVVAAPAPAPHEVKYKRRKNQQERVVLNVSAQDLCSDKWAWRKYGQKPIKGSPYPRSYYRCSTSKGCLARKQVERSHSDPEMFVISYTNEHCHGEPTRRNSLAGTTRHKFPTNKRSSAAASTDPNYTPTPKNSSPADLSPPTPSSVTMEDELYQQETKKESTEDEEEEDKQLQMGEASEHNGLFINDMLLKDDFLQSFDMNWID